MDNEVIFEVSPTCPSDLLCILAGECMALYFLNRELGTNLPRKREAVKASVDRAQCSDPEFVIALEKAREFLVSDDQKIN